MAIKEFTNKSFEDAWQVVRGESVQRAGANPLFGAPGLPSADEFNTGPTPAELHEIYSRGFLGINPSLVAKEERDACDRFMTAMPRLYDVFPWAKGIGTGKVAAPYVAALHFSPSWGGDEAQTRGSCTVHGTGNAAEMDHANDALFGETEYKGRLVKENIYRSRGYNGDGWSCSAPCRYIGPEGKGGLLFRKLYTSPDGKESVDFTRFSSSTENWAGQGSRGVPAWLEEESRKNKAKWIIPIQSLEEYRDAIYLGFGVNVCSGYGFSSETDEYGVASQRGSWSHAMAHVGYVDTDWARSKYGDMIGNIQQSWGRWNRQNGRPEGAPPMAVGQFYVKANSIAGMLRGSDSFAVCGVWGWDRTGWEAFNVTDLLDHLRNSTTQDYYKTRQEKAAEATQRVLAGESFLAV